MLENHIHLSYGHLLSLGHACEHFPANDWWVIVLFHISYEKRGLYTHHGRSIRFWKWLMAHGLTERATLNLSN